MDFSAQALPGDGEQFRIHPLIELLFRRPVAGLNLADQGGEVVFDTVMVARASARAEFAPRQEGGHASEGHQSEAAGFRNRIGRNPAIIEQVGSELG